MKKLFFTATLLASLFGASSAMAQPPGGGDPQQARQRMIERIKPELVDSAKITSSEADKVLEIYGGSMQQRRDIRTDNSMSDDDKNKKIAALDEEAAKKYKAIPLTDEQAKAVSAYFDGMRKRRMNRGPQGNQ